MIRFAIQDGRRFGTPRLVRERAVIRCVAIRTGSRFERMSLRRLLEDCSHAFSARPPWLLRASGIMAFRSSPAFVAILFGVSGFCEVRFSSRLA